MQVANVRLRLSKTGNDVPLKDVTPAEAMLLHILHGPFNGGSSFGEKQEKIEVVGEALVGADVPDKVEPDRNIAAVGKPGEANYQAARVEKGKVLSTKKGTRARTDAEELARLRAKYSMAKDKTLTPIVDKVWPDKFNPKLPQKFEDIDWKQASSSGIETANLNYVTGGLPQHV
jgi:hypothetical protein